MNIDGTYCMFPSKTSTSSRRVGDLNDVFVLHFYYSLLIRTAAKDLFISCTMDTVKILALFYV